MAVRFQLDLGVPARDGGVVLEDHGDAGATDLKALAGTNDEAPSERLSKLDDEHGMHTRG